MRLLQQGHVLLVSSILCCYLLTVFPKTILLSLELLSFAWRYKKTILLNELDAIRTYFFNFDHLVTAIRRNSVIWFTHNFLNLIAQDINFPIVLNFLKSLKYFQLPILQLVQSSFQVRIVNLPVRQKFGFSA